MRRQAAEPQSVALSLAVQYAAPAPALTRARLRRWVQRALAGVRHDPQCAEFHRAVLVIRLVDEAEGEQLNHAFRDKAYATNVLTFAYGVDEDGVLSADIILCLPVLAREASEQDKTLLHHAAHLTVHGVLHALDYDHLDDAEAAHMQALESQILHALGVPDPYADTGENPVRA